MRLAETMTLNDDGYLSHVKKPPLIFHMVFVYTVEPLS